MSKPVHRAWILTALGVFVVGLGGAVLLMVGHGRVSVDTSSDAYRVGYSNVYAAKGAQRAVYHDPRHNPYLTMPQSQWDDYANARIKDADNGECGVYRFGTGDWHDYAAGANQALQDIASAHAARFDLLLNADPDCD